MKKTILFIFALNINLLVFGQSLSSINDLNIPQEKIYVHHNDTFFLTGEYIYYKIYCTNDATKNLSDFSKIGYVELVGKDNNIIFKHKIRLENGIGQGDFFIPSSVLSGNYKLIAYTQWMKNTSIDNFYQNDISILNPFQNDQKNILSDTDNKQNNDDAVNNKIGILNASSNNILKIDINSNTYGSREKVTLKFNDLSDKTIGSYSISVKKIDGLKTPYRKTAILYTTSNEKNQNLRTNTNKTAIIIPELRGELLVGKIFFKENNKPAENVKVALSIPGKNYIFKVSTTNKSGNFYFNLVKEYENNNAIIQIINKNEESYDIELKDLESIDYNSLTFDKFIITPELEKLILQHSVSNQIENAYATIKPDSLENIHITAPFFNKPTYEYLLDDYTRFPTVKETIVEVIEQASIRKTNDQFNIHVRVYDDDVESGLKSLLLVDGIYVQNHNAIINAKSSSIKKISVVNEQYVYGSQVFEGIIILETFDAKNNKLPIMNDGKKIKLFKPLAKKKYFNQEYLANHNLDRIPDYRAQLAWEPNLIINENSSTFTFYTSDLKGDFKISLEGFNKEGKPVSVSEIIKVK